jgi:hypothetical protein
VLTFALPAFVQGGCLWFWRQDLLFLGHLSQSTLVLLLPPVLLVLLLLLALQLLLLLLLGLGLLVLHVMCAEWWAACADSDLCLLRLAQCTDGAAE